MKRRASIRSGVLLRDFSKAAFGHQAAWRGSGLVEEPPGPTEKGAELIRVNDKVKDKRDRSQHEDQVSHWVCPASAR
jgi:hypothetical protein